MALNKQKHRKTCQFYIQNKKVGEATKKIDKIQNTPTWWIHQISSYTNYKKKITKFGGFTKETPGR